MWKWQQLYGLVAAQLLLACGSSSLARAEVGWTELEQRVQQTLGCAEPDKVVFSPDGRFALALLGTRTLLHIDVPAGSIIGRVDRPVYDIFFLDIVAHAARPDFFLFQANFDDHLHPNVMTLAATDLRQTDASTLDDWNAAFDVTDDERFAVPKGISIEYPMPSVTLEPFPQLATDARRVRRKRGLRAYVAPAGGTTVHWVDLDRGVIERTLSYDQEGVSDIAVTADGEWLFVLHDEGVSVVDTSDASLVRSFVVLTSVGDAFSLIPNSDAALVVEHGGGAARIVSQANGELLGAPYDVPASAGYGFYYPGTGIAIDDRTPPSIYLNERSGFGGDFAFGWLSIITPSNGAVHEVQLATGAADVALSGDRQQLYLATRDTLATMDVADHRIRRHVATCASPSGIAASKDTPYVFATTFDGELLKIDPAIGPAPVSATLVGDDRLKDIGAVTLLPDDTRALAYVITGRDDASLVVTETTSMTVEERISLPNSPILAAVEVAPVPGREGASDDSGCHVTQVGSRSSVYLWCLVTVALFFRRRCEEGSR